MEQEIHITLRFNLATGKANLNEIVYELKELRDPLMLQILEQILRGYDDHQSRPLHISHGTRLGLFYVDERKNLQKSSYAFNSIWFSPHFS